MNRSSMIAAKRMIGRGAFKLHRRCTVTYAGAVSKENVGISNDKAGEKPARQKSKVS